MASKVQWKYNVTQYVPCGNCTEIKHGRSTVFRFDQGPGNNMKVCKLIGRYALMLCVLIIHVLPKNNIRYWTLNNRTVRNIKNIHSFKSNFLVDLNVFDSIKIVYKICRNCMIQTMYLILLYSITFPFNSSVRFDIKLNCLGRVTRVDTK